MAGFAAVSTFSLFSLLFLVSLTTAIVIKPQQPFISLRQRNSYRAAAFQLSSVASPNRSPKENIEDTLQVFRVAAANASQEFQPEVMVFPEAILWSTGLARGRETIGDYAEEVFLSAEADPFVVLLSTCHYAYYLWSPFFPSPVSLSLSLFSCLSLLLFFFYLCLFVLQLSSLLLSFCWSLRKYRSLLLLLLIPFFSPSFFSNPSKPVCFAQIPSPEAVTAAFCDSDDSLAVGPQLRSLSCIAKSCRSVVAANVIQTLPCQKGGERSEREREKRVGEQ